MNAIDRSATEGNDLAGVVGDIGLLFAASWSDIPEGFAACASTPAIADSGNNRVLLWKAAP
jgi:hypothetical protein